MKKKRMSNQVQIHRWRPQSTVTPTPCPNRQAPDEDLLRRMQRKYFDDWNVQKAEEDKVHGYAVKAETWGMPSFPS